MLPLVTSLLVLQSEESDHQEDLLVTGLILCAQDGSSNAPACLEELMRYLSQNATGLPKQELFGGTSTGKSTFPKWFSHQTNTSTRVHSAIPTAWKTKTAGGSIFSFSTHPTPKPMSFPKSMHFPKLTFFPTPKPTSKPTPKPASVPTTAPTPTTKRTASKTHKPTSYPTSMRHKKKVFTSYPTPSPNSAEELMEKQSGTAATASSAVPASYFREPDAIKSPTLQPLAIGHDGFKIFAIIAYGATTVLVLIGIVGAFRYFFSSRERAGARTSRKETRVHVASLDQESSGRMLSVV